jgi:hypothetical protein
MRAERASDDLREEQEGLNENQSIKKELHIIMIPPSPQNVPYLF